MKTIITIALLTLSVVVVCKDKVIFKEAKVNMLAQTMPNGRQAVRDHGIARVLVTAKDNPLHTLKIRVADNNLIPLNREGTLAFLKALKKFKEWSKKTPLNTKTFNKRIIKIKLKEGSLEVTFGHEMGKGNVLGFAKTTSYTWGSTYLLTVLDAKQTIRFIAAMEKAATDSKKRIEAEIAAAYAGKAQQDKEDKDNKSIADGLGLD